MPSSIENALVLREVVMGRIGSVPERLKLSVAFASIYLIWGSTFLAIRYAVETVPPLLMMGTREVLAGAAIFGFALLKGGAKPSLRQWRSALLAGSLLFLIGHGGLAWAQQRMPSGPAALVSSTSPLWIVLFAAFQERRRRLGGRVLLGLILGFAGIVLLAKPGDLLGGAPLDLAAVGVLVVADVSWAAGSLYTRNAGFPRSPALTAGMSLLAGGGALFLAGLLGGEGRELGAVSSRSVWALVYLVVFGSIVAFAAYTWLLRVASPARVATHAFVNPVVAVLAGWALGGEVLDGRTALAALAMVGGAAAIVTHRSPRGEGEAPLADASCGACRTVPGGPGGFCPCCECPS